MKDKKIVALYIRQGDGDGKVKALTIKNQKSELHQLCREKGYTIYKVYCDEWSNGANYNRTGLTELLKDLNDKKFDTIVTYSRDRLMTGLFNVKPFFEMLNSYNCNIETYLSFIRSKNNPNA